jgi:hypothetical protein
MRISTFDISGITTVRRHEASLRYPRYLFIFNFFIFLSEVAIPQLIEMTSFRGSQNITVWEAALFAFSSLLLWQPRWHHFTVFGECGTRP